MKKQLLVSAMSAALMAGAAAMPTVASAGWSANVGMVSDYRFRGMSQNDETIALQGGFDYAHDSGFYVGTWASSIDWQDQGPNGNTTSLELDLYGGYGGDIGDTGLSYDLGVIRYIYPNQTNAAPSYDTTEIYGSLSYSIFSASLSHSSELNFLGADNSTYLNLAVDYEFENGVGVGASWGDFNIDAKGPGNLDYNDWKLYVSKSFGGFDFEASYVDTDEDGACAGGGAAPFQCDNTFILAVSKSFE